MLLSYEDFLLKLACGQLKNTSAVDDSIEGFVKPEFEHVLLGLTNQGITDITTRKKVFEERRSLVLLEGVHVYELGTEPGEAYHRLVRVFEIIGRNDAAFTPKTSTAFTMPSPSSLRFSPKFIEDHGPEITVLFQRTHPEVTAKGTMDLPEHLYEALVLYVSALFLSHMGGEEHTAKGDSYYAQYLRLLQEDEFANTSGTSEIVEQDARFTERGFV